MVYKLTLFLSVTTASVEHFFSTMKIVVKNNYVIKWVIDD